MKLFFTDDLNECGIIHTWITPGSSGSAWAAFQPIAFIIETSIIILNDAHEVHALHDDYY